LLEGRALEEQEYRIRFSSRRSFSRAWSSEPRLPAVVGARAAADQLRAASWPKQRVEFRLPHARSAHPKLGRPSHQSHSTRQVRQWNIDRLTAFPLTPACMARSASRRVPIARPSVSALLGSNSAIAPKTRQYSERRRRSVSIPAFVNEAVDGVLRDLAYDLAYYEADPVLRREDSSFYGDDRARTEIREALQKLAQSGVNVGK
jgi:hypothetical protein